MIPSLQFFASQLPKLHLHSNWHSGWRSAIPDAEREGRVFVPLSARSEKRPLKVQQIGKVAGSIGEKENVVVNRNPKSGKTKYASCHDLRRSIGERWAQRIMPQVLIELMRHSSIETTLKYYVGRDAQTTSAVLWEAAKGNTSGNTSRKRARSPQPENERSPEPVRTSKRGAARI